MGGGGEGCRKYLHTSAAEMQKMSDKQSHGSFFPQLIVALSLFLLGVLRFCPEFWRWSQSSGSYQRFCDERKFWSGDRWAEISCQSEFTLSPNTSRRCRKFIAGSLYGNTYSLKWKKRHIWYTNYAYIYGLKGIECCLTLEVFCIIQSTSSISITNVIKTW